MATNTTLHVTATSKAVREAMRSIPEKCVRSPETRQMMERCGDALLGRIRAAFLVKSGGGTDDSGDRWAPLSPRTVAYSRRAGRGSRERGRESRPSQALTREQQKRWWSLYSRGLAMFGGSKVRAARRAWTILRAEGATTLFDKYGHHSVRILYDTGALYRSISVRVNRNEAIISSSHPAAVAHHNGRPGKLPQRRLWPGPRRWPDTWWRDLIEIIQQEAVRAAERLASEA